MNLILGYGFNNIHFGMLDREVIESLGLPDKQFESDFDIHLQYFSFQSDLWFRKNDNRFHWIECSHPETKIFDHFIMSINKDELITFFNSKINDELEYNDFGSFESYIFYK